MGQADAEGDVRLCDSECTSKTEAARATFLEAMAGENNCQNILNTQKLGG